MKRQSSFLQIELAMSRLIDTYKMKALHVKALNKQAMYSFALQFVATSVQL